MFFRNILPLLLITSFALHQVNEAGSLPTRDSSHEWDLMRTSLQTTTSKPTECPNPPGKRNYQWNSWQKTGPLVTMPFEVSPDFPVNFQALINRTVVYHNTLSCYRLVARSQLVPDPVDYIVIEKYSGNCNAIVGRLGGRQVIRLNSNEDGCLNWAGPDAVFSSGFEHEIFHSVGFRHEHVRSDRDAYISVNHCGMSQEKYLRSYQVVEGEPKQPNWLADYDLASFMHYPVGQVGSDADLTVIRSEDYEKAKRPITTAAPTQLDVLKLNLAGNCDRSSYECIDPDWDPEEDLSGQQKPKIFYPGFEYQSPSCTDPRQTMIGSSTRRCIYGQGWTGTPAICLATDAVYNCNFETPECPTLFNTYGTRLTRTKVMSMFTIEGLHYDLSTSSSTGHVHQLKMPGNPTDDHPELSTARFTASCTDRYCLRFGYAASSSERVNLIVDGLLVLTEKFGQLQLFSGSVSLPQDKGTTWRYETVAMSFNKTACPSEGVVFLVRFKAVPASSSVTTTSRDWLALDEISLSKNLHCDGMNSMQNWKTFTEFI